MQIGLRAQFHELPTGELPPQGHPELLAVLLTIAMPHGQRVRRLRLVNQRDRTSTASEVIHLQFQKPAADVSDASDAADQVAAIVPALQRTGGPASG